jgi:hypothetical protein
MGERRIKMITHEEAKYIIYKNSTICGVKIEDTNKLIDYNTQQEIQSKRLAKVEDLLGLYQYLNENTNDYDLNPDEVDEIHNKIYELEEELK